MKRNREESKNRITDIQTQWLIPVFVALLELLFHWEIYRSIDIYMLYAVVFSLPFSALVLLISGTSNHKWKVVVRSILLFLITIYYTVQLIYHQVFGNFLFLKSVVNGAGQAMDFGFTIWEAFVQNAVVIVVAIGLWGIYVALEIRCCRVCRLENQQKEQYEANQSIEELQRRNVGKKAIIYLVVMVLLPVVGTFILMQEGVGIGTTYDVKLTFHRTEQSMYRLGLVQTLKKDLIENICEVVGITEKQINAGYLWIEKAFFVEDVDKLVKDSDGANLTDKSENTSNAEGESKENGESALLDSETTSLENVAQEAKYHTWNIDFDILIENAENEDVKDVHTYFSQQQPTAENEYTGLFEGYNLIYITAESFSDVVIDKERTPTLYRMQQEGFQFDNFYTPSWYLSTIDGEYVNLLGQIPVEGDWSLQHSAENVLPVALGNQLAEQGYVCNAYHNHDSYYYDRTITHPRLGYTFKAVGAGLTFESMYPESDLELVEITVDQYINQNAPFHTYYMTMSGHLPYTYAYNSMAVKNQEVVANEEWSENAACYLAANMELEYAVAYLVEQLEEGGQLDNTLFVIAPDHYPYGLKRGAYDELLGEEVENDDFEVYRNGCLIWSAAMKNMDEISFPVQVDKYCSNLDLLPTISNLMGLSYDSRFFAGKDMLSEEKGLVLFKDHSFLTDKVRYNATTGEVKWQTGVTEDSIYLEECMELVQNRFYYSAKMLELDYYSLVKLTGAYN